MNRARGSLGSPLPSRRHSAHRQRPARPNRASQNAPRYKEFRVPASGPGGADRVRTDDLRLARAALSQLSYSPFSSVGQSTDRSGHPGSSRHCRQMVGLGRFELPTSRLSGVRSNQLSYRPVLVAACDRLPDPACHLYRSVDCHRTRRRGRFSEN